MGTVARYHLRQRFSYDYPGPIRDLRHRLVISPAERHFGQRRLSHRLRVAPELEVREETDAFGNAVVQLRAQQLDRGLEIELESTIERWEAFGLHPVPRGWLDAPAFREPSGLTRPDDALLAVAARLRAASVGDEELAAHITAFVAGAMTYRKDVTNVATTAAEAFALRAGVCQDFAHVTLAIARACGLAARYVSGHVLGEGGTHAWVEIILPADGGASAVAWPFDPTYNAPQSLDHVVVAIGRDYADVAPTSGTFAAPYAGVLRSDKTLRRSAA